MSDYSYPPTDESADPFNSPISSFAPTDNTPANSAQETPDELRRRALAAGFYASPQWTHINSEIQEATADLDAARDRLEGSLAGQPGYAEALQQKQSAQADAAALHERGAAMSQILPAAQRDLRASQAIAQLKRSALAQDPQLQAARARLQAAVAARNRLQSEFRARLDKTLPSP